ncbi:MAG: alpha/beta hydrolase [Candidatus Binatia bacterium]
MQKLIGDLVVDVFPPEFAKFKAPLVLVHGLWGTSSCWAAWANHFSNLGWECWAINFKGRPNENQRELLAALTMNDCRQDLLKTIRAAPEPPIIIAHGFGALIAFQAATQENPPALVLLSPVSSDEPKPSPSKALRLLRIKYSPLLWLGRPFRLQDKDYRQVLLAAVLQNRQPEILRTLVPESARLMREFFARTTALSPGDVQSPVLLLGGSDDRVVATARLRETARKLGAEFLEYPGHGHWMMGEKDGEKIVRDIHRWLVQTLGEKILLADFPQSSREL